MLPARRSIVSMMLSTCSWLASSSSELRPPLLAEALTRACSSLSRLLTSERPPSAVPMMLPARSALSIACVMPTFSARRFSLAISPAGLSAPVLIFRPVLSRVSDVLSFDWFMFSVRWASSEGTLVLIRVMGLNAFRGVRLVCEP